MAGKASFTKLSDITDPLMKAKDARAGEELLKKATSGPSHEVIKETANKQTNDVIDAQLPKEVITAYGRMPYSEFKERYTEVYAQVGEKTHLLTGRVTHLFTMGKIKVLMRTLKTRERAALIPLVSNAEGTDLVKFNQDDIKYRVYLLVLGIVTLDAATFPDIALSPETFDAWMKDEKVVAAYNFLLDLDESLLMLLYSLFMDLATAKQFALIENLKNQ